MKKLILVMVLGIWAMPAYSQNFNDWGQKKTIGSNPQFGEIWVVFNQDNTRTSGSTKGAGGYPYQESGGWTLDKKNGKACRKFTWRNGNISCL